MPTSTDSNRLPPNDPSLLLKRAEVARILSISVQTLARWAHEGCGPRSVKIGPRLIAYRASELFNWINANSTNAQEMVKTEQVDIVFDGPPGPESGRFVEVEDAKGQSVHVGTWLQREDNSWALRLRVPLYEIRR